MRKSTLIMLTIAVVAAVGMTVLFQQYVDVIAPEIRTAKDLTALFRADLLPSTDVKLRRVPGRKDRPVTNPDAYGLLIDATPAPAQWTLDDTGEAFAKRLGTEAMMRYGADRAVEWCEVRLAREGAPTRRLAFDRHMIRIEWPPPEPAPAPSEPQPESPAPGK